MASQTNVINDLGNLLKVPNKVLDELVSKADLCIGSIIHDASMAGEETIIINIGIGVLGVNLMNMQCKFVPSKELKQSIKKALNDKIDPLEIALDKALVEKLITVCNEEI